MRGTAAAVEGLGTNCGKRIMHNHREAAATRETTQHLYGNPQLAQPAPPTEQKHRAPQRQRNKNGSYLDGLYSPLRVQLRHPLLVFSPVVVVVVDHVPPLQGEWPSRKGMLVRAAACGMSIISGKEIVATMPGQKVHI